jgi:hypothetical protein
MKGWVGLGLGLEVLTFIGNAMTYYVSTVGRDGSSGSEAQPWLTLDYAAVHAGAGDSVLIQPGVYTNLTGRFSVSGSPSHRITFRGLGAVTNTGSSFQIEGSYLTFEGLILDHSVGGFTLEPSAHHCIISNCVVQNNAGNGVGFDSLGGITASDCLISSCLFNSLTGTTYVTLRGTNNVVEKCTFANGASSDAIRFFGISNVVRQCCFTNMALLEGNGNHPDILQTFGDNGEWVRDFLFERNVVVHCPVQLIQATMDRVTDTNKWGATLRNNLFLYSDMQGSCGISHLKFLNNTWYRCNNSSLQFGYTEYAWPYGGVVQNNAWIECYHWYGSVSAGPDAGPLAASDAGNGGRNGSGYARLSAGGGIINVSGTYSNLTGDVTGGTIYIIGVGDLYSVDASNFSRGTFSASIAMTSSADGMDLGTQWGGINAHRMGFRINSTAFTQGEISGALGAYRPVPAADLNADYNYVGGADGAAVPDFKGELHGINGGDPKLAGMNVWPATQIYPKRGSVLIDAGTNLTLRGITNDFRGIPRPQGAGYDIGAFEFIASPEAPKGLHESGL